MQAVFVFKDGAHMRMPIAAITDSCIRKHPEDQSRDYVFEYTGRRAARDNAPVYQEARECTPIPIFRARRQRED